VTPSSVILKDCAHQPPEQISEDSGKIFQFYNKTGDMPSEISELNNIFYFFLKYFDKNQEN